MKADYRLRSSRLRRLRRACKNNTGMVFARASVVADHGSATSIYKTGGFGSNVFTLLALVPVLQASNERMLIQPFR